MGVYRRKLKRGVRFYFSGQYLNVKYFSRAIYKTKQEASRAERARRNEIDEQARNPVNDMTLLELTNRRLDHIQTSKSIDYYKENRRYFRKILAVWGKGINVSQITKAMVNDLLIAEAKRLKKSNRSNHKVNSLLRSLKALFNYGIKVYDLNIKNPANLDFYPIDIKLKYIPPEADIEAVKAISTPSQRLLIDFVDETGCRIMEAIRFKHEDMDRALITLWTRKAKNSNLTPRRIPTPSCLEGLKGKGRVFKEWNMYPRFLEEKIKHLDQKKWNWHNLRHRRASIWATDGMTIFELMTRLGHNNIQTTQRYLQLLGFTRF